MANVNYYLGPYVWIDDSWQPPASTVGSIDLRNLPNMSTPIVQDGVGFFATTELLGVGYDLLGQGDLRDINSTGLMKSTWLSVLGYTPKGDKLVDLLYDHLVFGSDPTGVDDCKPLLPDSNNTLALYLPGHSRVKVVQFRVGHSPESNSVVAVLKEDYKKIRTATLAGDYPADTHRRVLGYWARQFKIGRPQDIFIPGGLPKEDPLLPSSLFTENFDGADNAAVGKQLTWVEGDVTDEWENRDNSARRVGLSASGQIERTVRCTSSVSSADHECQITAASMGGAGGAAKNTRIGVALRYSSSVKDCYFLGMGQTLGTGDGPTTNRFPGKIVADVETSFGNSPEIASVPFDILGRIAGSTIKMFINGGLEFTKTDTAITGNLFGGIWGFNNNANDDIQIDDWSITDDLPTPEGASSLLMGLL